MRKKYLLLVLFLVCVYSGLRAQTFSLITGREPVASLDGLWRFHTGDNPAWASPDFDDSRWPLLRSDESWSTQGYSGYSGFAWYRFRVVVPAGEGSLSLLLPKIVTNYQVYVDGSFLGGCGKMPPHPVGYSCRPSLFTLPPSLATGPRTVTIAIRVWQRHAWASYAGGGPYATSYFGATPLIRAQFQSGLDAHIHSVMQNYFLALIAALGGLVSLALFLFRRQDKEYLWFGCMLLLEAASEAWGIYRGLHSVGIRSYYRYNDLILDIGLFASVAFYYALLRGRRTWFLYVVIAALLLDTLTNLLYSLPNARDYVSVPVWGIFKAVLTLPLTLWILVLLLQRAREKLADARLLLVPVVLVYADQIARDFIVGTFQLGWQHRYTSRTFAVFLQPFPVSSEVLPAFLFLLAMLAILVNRFARTRSEEERYANEFEAARSVQSLLIPAVAPSTPGFTVESVYLPASEVGGDFFQVQPGDDGSLLIVVGDVSGKGLKAAMTVSTIVGALRNETSREPAKVLAHLNRVLHGQVKGFVTCCATLIAADGAMTLANAGHLAPYRNGEEMAVASGLPLGILAEGVYKETHYQLAPGDRLTFISDGVVEATNDKRELFGFERTQAISSQPAQNIAETARKFGQEDDISVLSVRILSHGLA